MHHVRAVSEVLIVSSFARAYELYRDVFLHSIPNEQILAAVCEGHPIESLRRFRGDPRGLRAHMSRVLGKIEREHQVFIPEWAAPCQTFLVDTLAAAVEVKLYGRPSLMVGQGVLQQQVHAKRKDILTP